MKKLIDGIQQFRRELQPAYVERFAHLALGQSPDCLFVACSDSRVVPNTFASTDPGDLFVVRNVGNLVPTSGALAGTAESAAIEFAVHALGVRDIVVCGHSQCGAMKATLAGGLPFPAHALPSWLDFARPSVSRLRLNERIGPGLPEEDRLSQVNVLQQIEHLRTHPAIREREAAGALALHAWWFDLAHAEVHAYDPDLGQFTVFAPLGAAVP